MKKIILERIYGNMGKGFKESFVSNRLKQLDLYDKIKPITTHKGKNKRFIYKRIDTFSVFVNSIPVENDDLNRANNYISHFILLENEPLLNPTSYIYSKSFISTIEEAKKKEKEISYFQKISIEEEYEDKNKVINLIKSIIHNIPKDKKIIIYIENIDEGTKLLVSTFKLIPKNIAKDISFSIGIEKLNENNICDINILLTSNMNKIPTNLQRRLVYNDKKNINSNYTHFLEQNNTSQIEEFLSFIEKREFPLKNLESASKAYLIDIGKYPIKTEEDILDNIIGLFDKDKLNNFLSNYIDKNIPISIKTLKSIDNIVNKKYGQLSPSSIYYKFIVKYSKNNYQYFLEKYKHDKNIFLYLLSLYQLDENIFIEQLKNNDDTKTLNFLSKNRFYKEIFYIQKNKLILVEKSWLHLPFSSKKVEIEEKIFIEYFSLLSKSKDSINNYFLSLLESSSQKLELLIFIHNKYKKIISEKNLMELYIKIDNLLSFKDLDNREIKDFMRNNNFLKFTKIENIKLIQIEYFLRKFYINNDNLNKILEILQ